MTKFLITTALALALGSTVWAQPAPKKSAEATVKDPVCGMAIDPKTAAAKSDYKGKTYYFCSSDEKAQFDKAPESYIKPAPKKKAS